MIPEFKVDALSVKVYESRVALGKAAAKEAGQKINDLLKLKSVINIIFAAAPSQNEFLAALCADETIDWTKINAFHMDEYLGLPGDATQLFGNFLRSAIFGHKPFHSVNYIDGQTSGVGDECERYSRILLMNPPDIVFMGIGENTHLAFNDPGDADFNDPAMIKQVPLDPVCRQQQVNDGCFETLNDVPTTCTHINNSCACKGAIYFLYGSRQNKS